MYSDKLRNAGGSPLMGLAQWVGRKIKNHDPMKEIDGKSLAGTRSISKRKVSIALTDPDAPVILCELANGLVFEIQVREVEAQVYAKAPRIAVGD